MRSIEWKKSSRGANSESSPSKVKSCGSSPLCPGSCNLATRLRGPSWTRLPPQDPDPNTLYTEGCTGCHILQQGQKGSRELPMRRCSNSIPSQEQVLDRPTCDLLRLLFLYQRIVLTNPSHSCQSLHGLHCTRPILSPFPITILVDGTLAPINELKEANLAAQDHNAYRPSRTGITNAYKYVSRYVGNGFHGLCLCKHPHHICLPMACFCETK